MAFRAKSFLAGGGVGFVNGLLGGGGGMVAVPALCGAGLGVASAHATAIAVVLPASLASAFVYRLCGLLPLEVFVPGCVGTVLGGFFGANALDRVPQKALGIAFAALMLAAGLKMVIS